MINAQFAILEPCIRCTMQFFRNINEELGRRRWEVRAQPQAASQLNTVCIICIYVELN